MSSSRKAAAYPGTFYGPPVALPTLAPYYSRKAVDSTLYASPLKAVCTPSTTDSRSITTGRSTAPPAPKNRVDYIHDQQLYTYGPPQIGLPHPIFSPTLMTTIGRGPAPGAASPRSGGAQFTIIANVPYDTVRQDLVSEFRQFGRVELAMVVCDEASRHPHKEWTSTAGYAFVRFSKRSEAAAAIQAATIGLITIRGTRVRADWARKDSYAKRGRVSAAQGAPALGPLGVPNGISLLRDSLSGGVLNDGNWQTQMYGPTEGQWTQPAPLNQNEAVLEVLENAFASAFNSVSVKEDNAVNHSKQIDVTGSSEFDAQEHLSPTVVLPSLAGVDNSQIFRSGRPEHLDSVLSPLSRNLLVGAISDVTAPAGCFLTDVSPVAGCDNSRLSARFFTMDKSTLLPPANDFVCAGRSRAISSRHPDGSSDFTTTNPSPACESMASDFSSDEYTEEVSHHS